MNSVLLALVIFAGVGVGLWLVSFAVEAIRPKPKPPAKLRWAPNIPITASRSVAPDSATSKRAKAPSSFFSTRSERSSICSRRLSPSFPSTLPSTP